MMARTAPWKSSGPNIELDSMASNRCEQCRALGENGDEQADGYGEQNGGDGARAAISTGAHAVPADAGERGQARVP